MRTKYIHIIHNTLTHTQVTGVTINQKHIGSSVCARVQW